MVGKLFFCSELCITYRITAVGSLAAVEEPVRLADILVDLFLIPFEHLIHPNTISMLLWLNGMSLM